MLGLSLPGGVQIYALLDPFSVIVKLAGVAKSNVSLPCVSTTDRAVMLPNASTVNPCFQDVFWPTAGSLTQTEPYALQGGNNTNTFLRFESEI